MDTLFKQLGKFFIAALCLLLVFIALANIKMTKDGKTYKGINVIVGQLSKDPTTGKTITHKTTIPLTTIKCVGHIDGHKNVLANDVFKSTDSAGRQHQTRVVEIKDENNKDAFKEGLVDIDYSKAVNQTMNFNKEGNYVFYIKSGKARTKRFVVTVTDTFVPEGGFVE